MVATLKRAMAATAVRVSRRSIPMVAMQGTAKKARAMRHRLQRVEPVVAEAVEVVGQVERVAGADQVVLAAMAVLPLLEPSPRTPRVETAERDRKSVV